MYQPRAIVVQEDCALMHQIVVHLFGLVAAGNYQRHEEALQNYTKEFISPLRSVILSVKLLVRCPLHAESESSTSQ